MRNEYENFVAESWKIEGINPDKSSIKRYAEIHRGFVEKGEISVRSLSEVASSFTNGYGKLRDQHGMNVRVGSHFPQSGGPAVTKNLEFLCSESDRETPYGLHQRFEHLHPFLDGNGRTGRLLWLWSMWHNGLRWQELGFLHTFYYQSLDNWDNKR